MPKLHQWWWKVGHRPLSHSTNRDTQLITTAHACQQNEPCLTWLIGCTCCTSNCALFPPQMELCSWVSRPALCDVCQPFWYSIETFYNWLICCRDVCNKSHSLKKKKKHTDFSWLFIPLFLSWRCNFLLFLFSNSISGTWSMYNHNNIKAKKKLRNAKYLYIFSTSQSNATHLG